GMAVTVPTVQTAVLALYVPWLGVALTSVKPTGSTSISVTLVALAGPELVSVIVKVMVSPTFGAALDTDLASARSATSGFVDVVALLFAGFGSNWSLCEIEAVLVDGLGETTVARSCSVCGTPAKTVPTVQAPVLELYDPWLGIALTKLTALGSVSC